MTTKVKQFTVSFKPLKIKAAPKASFFELAKDHIVKEKKPADRNLSKRVDEIVYGD